MTPIRETAAGGARIAVAAPAGFDETFFRVVARLFRPSFLYGAGVLLGTFDPQE